MNKKKTIEGVLSGKIIRIQNTKQHAICVNKAFPINFPSKHTKSHIISFGKIVWEYY